MFQTVDWTIPQLGGLLSQVCAMAPLHCPRARHPNPGPPASFASSKLTAAISTSASSPDNPPASTPTALFATILTTATVAASIATATIAATFTTARSLTSTSEPWPAASPQVIVKEERQLNEPKPVVTVKHVWNPEDLAGRPNTWNREDGTNKDPMRQKPMEDTDKMSVRQTFPPRYSRSTMLHERRSDEVLQAFRRQQDGNDGLQMRPAGTAAAPLTLTLSLILTLTLTPTLILTLILPLTP